MIKITCYNQTKTYPNKDRKRLMKEFREAARCCDGSEAERYWRIYDQLEQGLNDVTDEEKMMTHDELVAMAAQFGICLN